MSASPRPPGSDDGPAVAPHGVPAAVAELTELYGKIASALARGGQAPDRASRMGSWLEESSGSPTQVRQAQIEALVALGLVVRVPKSGTAARDRPDLASGPPADPRSELAALADLARALGSAIVDGVPDNPAQVAAMLDDGPGPRAEVTASRLHALVELGVLGRVTSGGTTRLVWTTDGQDTTTLVPAEPAKPDTEEFRLDLAIDVEHERLLLYRVAFAIELVGAIIIARQFLLGIL